MKTVRPSYGASLSRPAPRWVRTDAPERESVERLQAALHLPLPVCQLLLSRGFHEPEHAKAFLRPRLEQLSSPALLKDCGKAVDRIVTAITGGETIFVHGDYDVDGMASTAVLTRVLRGCGAEHVVPFVPNRLTDGYDLGVNGVRAAERAGASLVITCDCGTSAHESVEMLSSAGIDVIVTDHHLPGHGLPSAFAVVNPQQPGCASPDKDLVAAGVSYKLSLAICDALGVSQNLAHAQLDLVALATIADVGPLRGENRVLVKYGLKLLAELGHPGLRALVRAAALDGKTLTAGRVGFVLAPRLNAAGRIGDAKQGLALLLAESEGEANALARTLEELNRERQSIDQAVLAAALRQLDAHDHDDQFGLVLSGAGWHAGVIGIVASRIVEQTGRPTVLVAVADGVGKGSGRSIPGFDLHSALASCADCFSRFGGHRAAAGLTMSEKRIPEFRERFASHARALLTPDDLAPVLRIEIGVSAEEIGDELERLLRYFEPFGVGNAAPTFALERVELLATPRKIGANGLRFQFGLPSSTVGGIGWSLPAEAAKLTAPGEVDIAFRLERDDYMGRDALQLRVQAIRAACAAR